MTGIANIRRWYMVGTFATGDRAVMTIKTGAHDLRMVDRRCGYRCPGCRELLMTGIAYVTRSNVRCALATGRYAIVTSDTVTDKRRMINSSDGYPGIGAMA